MGGSAMERLAGKVILLWGWRRALTAFAAGAFAVLAQPPFDIFAVCFVSFPVLVWLLDGAIADPAAGFLNRLAPAFATGWWFGFGYFVAGLWWIGNALLVDAEDFAWALPLAAVALPALLALFYGFAAALARVFWSDGIGRIASLAFAFGAAEWLRTFVLTGFPWNAIGYAAMPVPVLMQSVSVVGLLGMNALAVFVFSTPALLAANRHRAVGLAAIFLLVALHTGFGFARLASARNDVGDTLAVRLVQPSIEQTAKWNSSTQDEIFRTYLRLSGGPAAGGRKEPQLVIWPETSLPFLLTDRPDALVAIGDVLDEGQVLLAGAVRAEERPTSGSAARFYNSIMAIDDAGRIFDAVDKIHLVPFGEYVPFEGLLSRLGVEEIVALPGGFSAGSGDRVLTLPGGLRILSSICYEIIFPGETGRAAASADLIVNVTNDAWYGDTPGPYQHFRQAQVRAVETGLPLVRAANNGISAAVSSYGHVVDAFGLDAVGALDVELPLARATVPASPARFGAGLGILTFFGLVGVAMSPRTRSR
jgi:apolipoprotein N-acyltransferase